MNPATLRDITQLAVATKRLMKVVNWIRRIGLWGFLFFLIKGLLWLTVPAMIALLAN